MNKIKGGIRRYSFQVSNAKKKKMRWGESRHSKWSKHLKRFVKLMSVGNVTRITTQSNTESLIFSSYLIRELTIIIHLTTEDPITSIWRCYQTATRAHKYFILNPFVSKNND